MRHRDKTKENIQNKIVPLCLERSFKDKNHQTPYNMIVKKNHVTNESRKPY